jgi:hypothetical protein
MQCITIKGLANVSLTNYNVVLCSTNGKPKKKLLNVH